jgi:hypothetical protein
MFKIIFLLFSLNSFAEVNVNIGFIDKNLSFKFNQQKTKNYNINYLSETNYNLLMNRFLVGKLDMVVVPMDKVVFALSFGKDRYVLLGSVGEYVLSVKKNSNNSNSIKVGVNSNSIEHYYALKDPRFKDATFVNLSTVEKLVEVEKKSKLVDYLLIESKLRPNDDSMKAGKLFLLGTQSFKHLIENQEIQKVFMLNGITYKHINNDDIKSIESFISFSNLQTRRRGGLIQSFRDLYGD